MGSLTMRVLVCHMVAVLLTRAAGHSRGHGGGDLLRANEAPVMRLTPEAMANEIALDWNNKDKTRKEGSSQDGLVQSIHRISLSDISRTQHSIYWISRTQHSIYWISRSQHSSLHIVTRV